jgi:hypothetical protein
MVRTTFLLRSSLLAGELSACWPGQSNVLARRCLRAQWMVRGTQHSEGNALLYLDCNYLYPMFGLQALQHVPVGP